MTRAEYETMMEQVLHDAQRLEIDGREIVLVMSRNIYQVLRRYERENPIPLLTVEMGTDVYSYVRYYGMRIGVIDEPGNDVVGDIENMVAPALVGMDYNPEANHLGDVIVISEENEDHLYRMTNDNPVQFSDLGLTVRFETNWYQQYDAGENATNAAATAAVANNAGGIQLTGGQLHFGNGEYINVGDLAFTEETTNAVDVAGTTATAIDNFEAVLHATLTQEDIERIANAFNEAGVNYAEAVTATTAYAEAVNEVTLDRRPKRGKRKNIVIEQELSPGDTKLLDDFLDSFKQQSMLQMGGQRWAV